MTDGNRVYRCDLTWLTSRWNCIFGRGCPGTRHENQGCCTVGAHWADTQDRERVEAYAQLMGPDIWQFQGIGLSDGITVDTDDGYGRTRIVEGGCIFLNRRGFPTGPGCALHELALREGISPIDTKPDVCWQIPMRIGYGWEEDDLVVSITEYDRAGWGPGGAGMNWWCSGNTSAHTASVPVYRSCEEELTRIMGADNYAALADVCKERAELPYPPHPHPADPPPAWVRS
ncbi:hypothetical protein OHV05_36470 (plasmid) [Kitasatospora sp. NBC_00070]|uniref:hypothetical protein n=1 Tax=Kitasatospora sp. NBC_00070 TaxID=2975962 RepID=UPI0032545889